MRSSAVFEPASFFAEDTSVWSGVINRSAMKSLASMLLFVFFVAKLFVTFYKQDIWFYIVLSLINNQKWIGFRYDLFSSWESYFFCTITNKWYTQKPKKCPICNFDHNQRKPENKCWLYSSHIFSLDLTDRKNIDGSSFVVIRYSV